MIGVASRRLAAAAAMAIVSAQPGLSCDLVEGYYGVAYEEVVFVGTVVSVGDHANAACDEPTGIVDASRECATVVVEWPIRGVAAPTYGVWQGGENLTNCGPGPSFALGKRYFFAGASSVDVSESSRTGIQIVVANGLGILRSETKVPDALEAEPPPPW